MLTPPLLRSAPEGLRPLRDYQQKALDFLENGGSYLALEQGTGKSRIMIEFAKSKNARRILVFCPASVRLAWESEIPKWWVDAPPIVLVNRPQDLGTRDLLEQEGFFVISYDRMSRGHEFLSAIEDVARRFGPYALAFCDEAHFLKNRGAARTKAIYESVRKNVVRMIVASGTPAPSHAGELFTAFRALAPEKIRNSEQKVMNQIQFEDTFCKVDTKWFGGRAIRVITGSQNIPQLRARFPGFLLRMTKKEVLPDMPPLDFVQVPIEPSMRGLNAEDITRFEGFLDPNMTDDDVLKALQSNDEHVARLRMALGLAKVESAVDYLIDFLEGTKNSSKIVVWSLHHAVIDKLTERLGDFHPVKLDGRSSATDRKNAVDTFLNKDKCRVFNGNILAAGTGTTLIGPECDCSDCFFPEAHSIPGHNLQAAARIHRLGQQDGVLARVFTARGTPDDRIQAIITRRTKELAEIFG